MFVAEIHREFADRATAQIVRNLSLDDGAHVTTTVGGSAFHTRRAGDSVHVDAQSPPSAWHGDYT